jgi:hypothetical protein
VIPSKNLTAAEKQKYKVGKAAYNPVAKDLMESRPTLEQVEKMIAEPRAPRATQVIDYVKFSYYIIQTLIYLFSQFLHQKKSFSFFFI